MEKSCSNCAAAAKYSAVVIISTVGVKERVQKSSSAVLFCDACLREFGDLLCSGALQKAVNSAYTALKQSLRERSKLKATA